MITEPHIIEATPLKDGLTRYVIDWPGRDSKLVQTTTLNQNEVQAQIDQRLARETKIKEVADNTYLRHRQGTPNTRAKKAAKFNKPHLCIDCQQEIKGRTRNATRCLPCNDIAVKKRKKEYLRNWQARQKDNHNDAMQT